MVTWHRSLHVRWWGCFFVITTVPGVGRTMHSIFSLAASCMTVPTDCIFSRASLAMHLRIVNLEMDRLKNDINVMWQIAGAGLYSLIIWNIIIFQTVCFGMPCWSGPPLFNAALLAFIASFFFCSAIFCSAKKRFFLICILFAMYPTLAYSVKIKHNIHTHIPTTVILTKVIRNHLTSSQFI